MAKVINIENNLTEQGNRVLTRVSPTIVLKSDITDPSVSASNENGILKMNIELPDVGKRLTTYIETNEQNISNLNNRISNNYDVLNNSIVKHGDRLNAIQYSLNSVGVACNKIEVGTANYSVSANSGGTISIPFSKHYQTAPIVVASPVIDGNFEVCLKIKSIINTRFYCYCYNNTSNNISVTVNYIAIPQGGFDGITIIDPGTSLG